MHATNLMYKILTFSLHYNITGREGNTNKVIDAIHDEWIMSICVWLHPIHSFLLLFLSINLCLLIWFVSVESWDYVNHAMTMDVHLHYITLYFQLKFLSTCIHSPLLSEIHAWPMESIQFHHYFFKKIYMFCKLKFK